MELCHCEELRNRDVAVSSFIMLLGRAKNRVLIILSSFRRDAKLRFRSEKVRFSRNPNFSGRAALNLAP
jgi:hypothetical protein